MIPQKESAALETIAPSHQHDWNAIRRFFVFTTIALAAIFFVGWLYFRVFAPVMIGAFIAYMIGPTIEFLERRKVPRNFGAAFIVILTLSVIAVLSVHLGPIIYDQLSDLLQKAPTLLDSLIKNVISKIRAVIQESGYRETASLDRALRNFNLAEQALTRAQLAVDRILSTGASVLNTAVNLVLIPFVTYFILAEKPRITQFARKLTPRDLRPYFRKLFEALDETLKAVVRGHIKVAATLAVLYSVGFSMLGMSAGISIGLVAGMCRVIPYLDAFVGIILGITYVFSEGLPPATVFGVFAVVGGVQMLDGAFVTPKLIGSKVGLHPAVVILTIMAFASHFGFWGVLTAIPIAATIKALYKMALPLYRDSKWFNNY